VSNEQASSIPSGKLWSMTALTLAIANIADLLAAVRKLSDNLYNLLIFDWRGATYLPWALGIIGYGLLAYAVYATVRVKRPNLKREAAVVMTLIPVITLFAVNVFAVGFGKHPDDVWKPVMERASTRLRSAADPTGGFRIDATNRTAPRQAWTTAQGLVASLMAQPGLKEPPLKSESELATHLNYLESARSETQGGWAYFPNTGWAVTEVNAWVTVANVYALRSPLVKSESLKTMLLERIVRDLQDISVRQTATGGWKPIDDQKYLARGPVCAVADENLTGIPAPSSDLTRTYSTIMALWAFTEARSLPSFPADASAKYDASIRDGVTWLLNNYFDNVGWVANPSRKDTRESFPGLTAQALFVLDRVNRVAPHLILQKLKLRQAKHEFLQMKGLKSESISANSRVPDFDIYLFPTNQATEGSTFLWFPWSLATLSDLQNDQELSADDTKVALNLRNHLLTFAEQEEEYLEQALPYELSETLIGLNVAFNPSWSQQ